MSADAHGGSGGPSGLGFFVVLIIVLAIAWFFAQLQKQREAAPITIPTTLEEESALKAVPDTKRTPTPLPASGHGTTYYLDAEGNILDVVRF